MAIVVPYQPQGLTAEQADGNILLTWQGSLGAASYQIQRSTDGVNFSNYASTGVTTQFLDSLPGIGIMYWYQVAGVNSSGTGPYSSIAQMVAAPPSEMSLFELRLRSQQTADRVGSGFVSISEWNAFLRISMYELYDLLINAYEENYNLQTVTIATNGTQNFYPLPDGVTNFIGGTYPNSGSGTPSQAFYKLVGVDLNVNTSNVTPSRVSLLKFDFIKRNQYVYPNSTSTIYGIYNLRYRLMGNQLEFIPVPAGGQTVTAYYCPKLPALLKDTDLTGIGTSGWLRYPIVRAAKYAIDKEQEGANTDKLDAEILFLKDRIAQMAANRDIGVADTISETRSDPVYGGGSWGGQGSNGGW